MSWSITAVGTPQGVSRKLDEYAETLHDQSKEEFMDAKPHLQALLAQVVNQNVRLDANGHAYFEGGQRKSGNIRVVLENFYGEWCE